MYNFEYKMENFIKEITLEEIGVALLGFFKTHTSLKNENLVKYIIDRTIDEIGRVPEITLASILKVNLNIFIDLFLCSLKFFCRYF